MYCPKISIIIPVYNGGNYIRESINSALAQTYTNTEVIVVNDGSNDHRETEKIAFEYSDRIQYYKKSNGGVSSALNFGISKMKGDWFSWLSHDDLYLPNKLEDQIKYLNDEILSVETQDVSRIVLYCNTEFINNQSQIILKLKPIAKEFEQSKDIILKNLKNNRLGGCSFLIHKSTLVDIGGFTESIRTISDYNLWYRLLLEDYKFYYVPKTLVQGRMHKSQVTYKLSSLGALEFENFYNWLLHKLDEKPEYNSVIIFLKIACYARQRGFFNSTKTGFLLAKKRLPILLYYLIKSIIIFYADVYRIVKAVIKKVFIHMFIK